MAPPTAAIDQLRKAGARSPGEVAHDTKFPFTAGQNPDRRGKFRRVFTKSSVTPKPASVAQRSTTKMFRCTAWCRRLPKGIGEFIPL